MSEDQPIIAIGFAGGSGAGKTTLARAVYENLSKSKHASYLVHDNYYKDISHLSFEERSRANFDHPDSLDTDLLVQHIRDLKAGKSIKMPQYDFTTHSRTKEIVELHTKKIIIVEGILIFSNPELVKELDVKVYVDAPNDIRLIRRITRDTNERGRTAHQVIDQYSTTVRPMHEEFVEPSKRVADIIVHSDNDKDSSHVALRMITNHLKMEIGIDSCYYTL